MKQFGKHAQKIAGTVQYPYDILVFIEEEGPDSFYPYSVMVLRFRGLLINQIGGLGANNPYIQPLRCQIFRKISHDNGRGGYVGVIERNEKSCWSTIWHSAKEKSFYLSIRE
jgi:hypothetical protein